VWNLKLGSELVFSGDAGTDEPSGPSSRRYGVDFEARWQINDWLYADYDLSWVHARFDNGGFVPLAPPILMNGGLTADFHNGFTIALRGRYLTDRPADEGNRLQAEGYYLLDLFAKYRWRNVELGIQPLNLTNTSGGRRSSRTTPVSGARAEPRSHATRFQQAWKDPTTPPGHPLHPGQSDRCGGDGFLLNRMDFVQPGLRGCRPWSADGPVHVRAAPAGPAAFATSVAIRVVVGARARAATSDSSARRKGRPRHS
jgi:hypothetical protein